MALPEIVDGEDWPAWLLVSRRLIPRCKVRSERWMIIITINLSKNGFKTSFHTCILAHLQVQHPVSFDNPCYNQFMRWYRHCLTIFKHPCIQWILLLVIQYNFYRLIDVNIDWLAQVNATRDVLDFNANTLNLFYYWSHHVNMGKNPRWKEVSPREEVCLPMHYDR